MGALYRDWGSYAPIIYKLYFSDRQLGYPPVRTMDLDSLIPRKLPLISIKKHFLTFTRSRF